MGTNQDTATLEQEPARQAGPAQQPEVPAAKRPVQVRRSQMAAARSVAMEAMNAPAPPTGTLLVGAANDPFEREADAMAQHVVQSLRSGRADGAVAQRSTAGHTTVRRKADVGLDGGHVSADVDSQINSARGGGKPIDTAMRAMVEPHFGQDFSNVGIHTGSQASKLTESVGAQAFAIGSDVFFAEPSMANDVGLLSHELTHVVQQGGAGRVQRKMWTKQEFNVETDETSNDEALGVIQDLIDSYFDCYENPADDVRPFDEVVLDDDASDPQSISRKRLPEAINLLLNMERTTEMFIAMKTSRKRTQSRNMQAMLGLQEIVKAEILTLRGVQADAIEGRWGYDRSEMVTNDDFGGVATLSKSDGLIAYEDHTQQASSVLEKLGVVVDTAVPNNGDTGEIEVNFKFPVEPSGVGFLGGRFKVEASKDDDMVKVRTEMAVTGGAEFPWAEVKGEMGVYLESQADSGGDAMALVSYGLYRRFRESAYVPAEVSNYLWGGNWGNYGRVGADEWSRQMEERMFSVPTPERGASDTDEAYATAMASHAAKLTRIRDSVYVESGGLVGVSATADAVIFAAEAAVQGLAGKRVDMTSLENTKGGAGAANKRSKGRQAQMVGAISGGTRGAEAKVSRGTRGFKLSSGVSGDVPGFTKLEGSNSLSVVYINDGKGGGYELDTNELEYSLKGEIPFSSLGRGVGALMSWLSGIAAAKINESINKVEESTPEEEKGTVDRVKGQLGNMASAAAVIKDAASPAAESQDGAEKSGLSSAVGLKISLTLDGSGDAMDGAIELSRYDDKELKIPKVMEATVKRTKRIVKYTFNGGGWS
jgi:hypothetical protein